MRETGIYAKSEQSVQSYKCLSGIFTQQGSTVVYKEKQINLHNMELVHIRILPGMLGQDKQIVNHLLKLLKKTKERENLSRPRRAFQPPKVLVMCCTRSIGTMLDITKV